jgi:hypothetical protein
MAALIARRGCSAALFSFFLLAYPLPASAMTLQVQGSEIIMTGRVAGDEYSQLLDVLNQHQITTVVLGNSTGGNANSGYEVGELIRQRGLPTAIRGSCASSCSRMWLGGVTRILEGRDSRVGLHGNYDNGVLRPGAPDRLRAWLPRMAPSIDRQLMEQWIVLPRNTEMMYFYNDRAELCDHTSCTPIAGWNAVNAGLATH